MLSALCQTARTRGGGLTAKMPTRAAYSPALANPLTARMGKGINCAIFRNESPHLSSDMILDAEEIAWRRWPQARLFTYVKAEAIASRNPGYCFKRAGWRQCGITKVNKLVILEKEAINED